MEKLKLLKKWKELPASVKASVAFAASTFLLRGISFITTSIFTRIMPTSQYGVISTYNSWLSIIEVFAVLGLTSAGVFNSGLIEYKDSRDQYIFSVMSLCNIVTLIVFGILALIKLYVPNFLIDNNLLLLMFIHFLFYPALIFWTTKQRYDYKYKLSSLITIGSVVIGQGIAIYAVMQTSQNHGATKLWANEIGWLIFCIPIYVYLWIKGFNKNNFFRWKRILTFAIPLIPHYLAQHVMSGADRIMITDLVSSSDSGIYNVVATLSMIALIFWNAINASLIPFSYEKISEGDYQPLNRIVKMLLLGYGLICLGVVIVAPEIMHFLAPKEYSGGLYAIPPIVGVAFTTALYNLYANVEFYYKKSVSITIATIVSAVVNIALNALLIPKFSYVGAAYTTLISNILLILLHYRGYLKATNKHIYDDSSILKIAVFVISVCLLSSFLYLNLIIRVLFLCACAILVFWKRKYILKQISEVRGMLYGKKNA